MGLKEVTGAAISSRSGRSSTRCSRRARARGRKPVRGSAQHRHGKLHPPRQRRPTCLSSRRSCFACWRSRLRPISVAAARRKGAAAYADDKVRTRWRTHSRIGRRQRQRHAGRAPRTRASQEYATTFQQRREVAASAAPGARGGQRIKIASPHRGDRHRGSLGLALSIARLAPHATTQAAARWEDSEVSPSPAPHRARRRAEARSIDVGSIQPGLTIVLDDRRASPDICKHAACGRHAAHVYAYRRGARAKEISFGRDRPPARARKKVWSAAGGREA